MMQEKEGEKKARKKNEMKRGPSSAGLGVGIKGLYDATMAKASIF